MGTTMTYLAKTVDCQVIGLDQSSSALAKAKQNISQNHLENRVQIVRGNALHLPFPDNSFDVLINEAMLTMLNYHAKEKAVAEYLSGLKTRRLFIDA